MYYHLPLHAINPTHTKGDFTKSNVLVQMELGESTAWIGHSELFIWVTSSFYHFLHYTLYALSGAPGTPSPTSFCVIKKRMNFVNLTHTSCKPLAPTISCKS